MNKIIVLCLMCLYLKWISCQVIPLKSRANDGEFNSVNPDGSFDFGYINNDIGASYHIAHGGRNKVVSGRFGAREPGTGIIKDTVYTAGPRGFRAKGSNIHRKMDLSQIPRGPIGNKDDPYFDPYENPSYSFNFNTRTYSKTESADSRGDVTGHYSFVDDVGERHNVDYIAGRDTGFHVSSAHPDSPTVIGSPFHLSPLVKSETKPRGRTAVQRGLDGSYRFVSSGPDQRRTESSDANGNVRGYYTFLDDTGRQRTVHYIAGPGIGYRIVKNSNDPYIPPYFPTIPSVYDPDFISGVHGGPPLAPRDGSDDVFKDPFGAAASGHVKPPPYSNSNKNKPSKSNDGSASAEDGDERDANGINHEDRDSNEFTEKENVKPTGLPSKPEKRPGQSRKPSSRPKYKPPIAAKDNEKDINSEVGPGYKRDKGNQRPTIIKNIGDNYLGIPPGVSVRAHVQSIDLHPYESKLLSPSEALEKDSIVNQIH